MVTARNMRATLTEAQQLRASKQQHQTGAQRRCSSALHQGNTIPHAGQQLCYHGKSGKAVHQRTCLLTCEAALAALHGRRPPAHHKGKGASGGLGTVTPKPCTVQCTPKQAVHSNTCSTPCHMQASSSATTVSQLPMVTLPPWFPWESSAPSRIPADLCHRPDSASSTAPSTACSRLPTPLLRGEEA